MVPKPRKKPLGQLKCSQCPNLYRHRQGLAYHLYNAHKIRHPCLECGMICKNQVDLKVHMKEMHRRRSFRMIKSSCPNCSDVFPSRMKMLCHLKNAHNIIRLREKRVPQWLQVAPFYTINYSGYKRFPFVVPQTEKEKEMFAEKYENLSCCVENCGKPFRDARFSDLRHHLLSEHEAGHAYKGLSQR